MPAHAEPVDFFHRETDKFWSVSGGANSETGQATCYGSATKKDGSFVEIHRSLVDGEVWAIIHDTAWEIQNEEYGTLRWNFFDRNDALINGSDFHFIVEDKNTILIPTNHIATTDRNYLEHPLLYANHARRSPKPIAQLSNPRQLHAHYPR